MSSSLTKQHHAARRSQAVGLEGSRLYRSPPVGIDQREYTEVHIQWKPVLQQVVFVVGGTEPVYSSEETGTTTFQERVTFRIFVDTIGELFEVVSVVGNKCASLCEAQSDAAAAALQRFMGGPFNMEVVDVSYLICEERKAKCEKMVNKAWNFQRGLEMLLSDWADFIRYMGESVDLLSNQIEQDRLYTGKGSARKARVKVAKRLDVAMTMSQAKHTMAVNKAAACKTHQFSVRALMRNRCNQHLIPRPERYTASFPRKIRVSMKLVLAEMAVSLGWDEPQFTTIWMWKGKKNICVSEVQLRRGDMLPDSGEIRVQGGAEVLESEATESAAKAGLFHLEKVMAIFLIDVNYNKRSVEEDCVTQAEELLDFSYSVARDAMFEWEEGVEDVGICDDRCEATLVTHTPKDPCNEDYNIKWQCAEAVSRLYRECVANFRAGRARFMSLCTPMKEE